MAGKEEVREAKKEEKQGKKKGRGVEEKEGQWLEVIGIR